MERKSGIFHLLSWICIWFSCNSCVLYKTILVPVNRQSLIEHKAIRPLWTISDRKGKTNMFEPIINNDSIFGKLLPFEKADHPKNLDNYRARKGRNSLYYFHLSTNSPPFAEYIKIPISDVLLASKHVNAYGLSIFSSLVVGVGGTILVGAVFCNCPYVNVIGADTTRFQGSLFPGAISKSLERQDNLIIKTVPLSKEGAIHVRISNELPEIEYFNQIELFEVRDMSYPFLGQHALGHPISYNLQDHLVNAATPENRNIKAEVRSTQEGLYDFSEQGNDYELNKVFLTFDKTNLKNDAMLVVRAKQSKWMETVAAFTLQQFGTAYHSWLENLDKADPKKYNQSAIERGISLNAYIKRNNRWDYMGSYANPGTLAYRDLVLNVDLHDSHEKNIEIKLEAAHGFWDIDYVGITDEWSEKVSLAKLNTLSAVNQKGANVMQALEDDDRNYTELPTEGDFINIHFEAPNDPKAYFILKGKGYYHHERKYTSKPNYKFLKAVKQDKMTSHQLSRLLQSQSDVAAKKTSNP